ncbi:hypothetical protein HG535_0C01070 [Zygotorulaspora mrakii]|uniref:Uncharacterized protein n=1 Tax=Zygotorulaspora mrakii TaxID=42260 RepID=A0A7H9AZB6_ZYGMR|nr:uncharacterized protein HG535_0C01070 [Zygotorulaspora mrakii]QLG71758.1 hypothetical protein HG535_0C01070 [Zygotorulaspora mrakii]
MRCSVVFWIISIFLLHTTNPALAAVLGIDYGQQFLKAMVVSPQAPMELILTPESKRKDVSGLAIRKLGSNPDDIERLFGSSVGSLSTRFPKDTLLHLKPLLGKPGSDMNDMTLYLREHPGVEIVDTKRNSLAFKVRGTEYSVEELVAMNIQEIINRANSLLKEKDPSGFDFVDRLSLTVPEFFTQHQRKALLDVGTITTDNLQTCLVNDGLSVLINFAFKHRDFTPGEKLYYIVYDMGSGSTKASLFSIMQPINDTEPLTLEIGGYGFNDRLGGSKFTLDIASLIQNRFLEQHKAVRTFSLNASPKSLAKIVQAAEKAKLVLSANSEAHVSIESLIDEIDFKTTISRSEFEEFIQEGVRDIAGPIEGALSTQFWDDPIDLDDLSGIILTGGSSRVPVVQEQLSKFVPEEKILRSVNADESAVNGATVRGVKIFDAFKTKPLNIIERSVFNYGIKVQQEESEEIIFHRGTEYPSQKTITIDPLEKANDKFTIDLYENDRIFKTVAVSTKDVERSFTSESCPLGVSYNITFTLSHNRIFDVDKAEAICQKNSSVGDSGVDSEKDVTDVNSDTSKNSKGKPSRKLKLLLTKDDTPIKHMSSDEKYQCRKHISFLVKTDKERYELEAAKNSLEALLYETRIYLENTDIIETGPKIHLERLAELIPDYLEWLEDGADDFKKGDIEEKISQIQKLRNKIETYLKYLSEPLDGKQFKDMLEKSNNLSQKLADSKQQVNDTIELIEDKVAEFDLDVHEEYSKISLPSYIARLLAGWDETLSSLREKTTSIETMIESGALEQTDRDDLLEMKLSFDEVSIEFEKKINAFNMGKDYRFRELLSLTQKLEKVRKRKEERLRKSMAEMNNSTSGLFSEATDTLEPSSLSSSTSTETLTAIFHDEL